MKLVLKNCELVNMVHIPYDLSYEAIFTTNTAYATVDGSDFSIGDIRPSTFFKSCRIDISNYNVNNISFTLPIRSRTAGGHLGYGVVFFDSNSNVTGIEHIKEGDPNKETITRVIPENTVSVGFTWWISEEYGEFKMLIWK